MRDVVRSKVCKIQAYILLLYSNVKQTLPSLKIVMRKKTLISRNYDLALYVLLNLIILFKKGLITKISECC
jgi:hypothetical protein